MSYSLPPECHLRPASAHDIWAIRKLVFNAKLDPTQIRWSQFWVIECEGQVVACGQLRSFSGAQELGSMVVAPAWRDRTLGSFLVKHLIAQAQAPLYLECLGDRLAQFYARFGFTPVAWQELPRALQAKFALGQIATKIIPFISVKIMRYQATE